MAEPPEPPESKEKTAWMTASTAELEARARHDFLRDAFLPPSARKPADYVAGQRLLGDPGALLDFTLNVCCNWESGGIRRLCEDLGKTRQSLWNWRQLGVGLPQDKKLLRKIERLLQDPRSPLKLPLNVRLPDLVRAEKVKDAGSGNLALQDFLDRVTASPDPRFGRPCLGRLLAGMQPPRSGHLYKNPLIFYKWAYGFGVPKSHMYRFSHTACALDLHELYDLRPKGLIRLMRLVMMDVRLQSEIDEDED